MAAEPGVLERILRWMVIERGTAEISDTFPDSQVATLPPALRIPSRACLAGPVVTLARLPAEAGGEQRSSFAVLREAVTPGDVILVACDPSAGAAFGSNIAVHAAACRAQALLTDGAWRDERLLAGVGIPVMAGSATPRKAVGRRYRPVETQSMFGLQWAAGDWLLADADGILRLAADAAVDVAAEIASTASGELAQLLENA